LGIVGFEIPLVDTPPTPRRDIAVIGLYGILFESSIAGEVSGVLTEYAFIEVSKPGIVVIVGGDNSSPLFFTTVASGPLSKAFELTGSVASVVSAVAPTPFALVLEVPLEALVEWCR